METIKIWSKEDWNERCRKYSVMEMPIKLPRERRSMQMASRYSQMPAEVINKCLVGLWHAMEIGDEDEEYKWRERLTYCGIDFHQQHSKSDFNFLKGILEDRKIEIY